MMRSTKRNRRAEWPLAVARVFVGALALSLAQPSEAAAQSECAPYISGGPNHPASGTLVGSRIVTAVIPLGLGIRLSFTVGVYGMHDGSRISVPCHLQ